MVNVLVADDHNLVREALTIALDADPDLQVTGVGTLDDVRKFIKNNGFVDVVLLDLIMPGMNGLPSVAEVVKINKGGAVALFSGNITPSQVNEILDLGSSGIIPKTLPLRSLASAIKLVADGEVFVPVGLSIESNSQRSHKDELLTVREQSILQRVSEGLTNKEIAYRLSVSEATIKANMRAICSKLDARNRASAVVTARNLGLI